MSAGGSSAPSSEPGAGRPRFTVVVPTFNRRELVVEHLHALAAQRFGGAFEVVVVVDGSTDGTAAALRALTWPFPLRVIEQPNRGAAAARNRGAREARGELLLFLDDDMEADPELLAVHDRRHLEGADAVVGHMPLHPRSPRHFLARASAAWVEHRRATLSGRADPLPGSNLLTGQVSVARRRFEELGGFDESFNLGGAYGREDTDFGLRLEAAGGRLVYDPQAISRQYYAVTPRGNLARWRQVGRASVALLRKHPFMPEFVVRQGWGLSRFDRWVGRWLSRLVAPPLLALLERGREPPRLTRLFFWLQHHQYYRGVRDAGGYPRRGPLRVLAYHALRDLSAWPAMAPFGIPPDELRRQLRWLRRCRARFVTADELVNYLHRGAGLPRRAVLLTFDDAYAELAVDGLAALSEQAAPAVVFAVSGRVGGVNDWDAAAGAPPLALCDADGLRRLAAHGVEIGSHGRSHVALDRLEPARLAEELERSVGELTALGLPPPRVLAYPYGRAAARERAAAASAGYAAAFTVRPGRVTPASDPLDLPRVEIRRGDRGLAFLAKVAFAGRGGRLRPWLWAVALAAAAVLLPRLGAATLAPWDEAIYAQVAREMLSRAEFLTPYWGGEPFFEKPPLMFWLTSLGYAAGGVSETTARLVSALSGVALAVLVAALAARLGGRLAGIVAALALLTGRGFAESARLGMLDVPLAAATWLAFAGYQRARDGRRGGWYLAAAASAAAVMLKSAAGLLAPGVLAVAMLIDRPRLAPAGRRELGRALLLGLALVAPWHLAMSWRHGAEFWSEYLGYHVLERVRRPLEGHVGGVAFYWAPLRRMLGPWLWLLPAALALELWRLVAERGRSCWLLVAAAAGLAVPALVETRIVWYLVPFFPAAAMLVGLAVAALAGRSPGRRAMALGLAAALAALALPGLRTLYSGYRSPVARLAEAVRSPAEEPTALVLFRHSADDELLAGRESQALFYSLRPVRTAIGGEELERAVAAGARHAILAAAGLAGVEERFAVTRVAEAATLVAVRLEPRRSAATPR